MKQIEIGNNLLVALVVFLLLGLPALVVSCSGDNTSKDRIQKIEQRLDNIEEKINEQ